MEESEEAEFTVPLEVVEEVRRIKRSHQPPLKVAVKLDTQDVCMEWDTEASVSIVCETQYKQLWPGRSSLEIKLQTYSKEHLVVVGSQDVQVWYENQKVTLPLVIVRGNGPTLFGRNWLRVIKFKLVQDYFLQVPGLQEVLRKCSAVFKEGLGIFTQTCQVSLIRSETHSF